MAKLNNSPNQIYCQVSVAVEYANCISVENKMSVLDMTQNYLRWGSVLELPGPLWPGVVASDKSLFMGLIELFGI